MKYCLRQDIKTNVKDFATFTLSLYAMVSVVFTLVTTTIGLLMETRSLTNEPFLVIAMSVTGYLLIATAVVKALIYTYYNYKEWFVECEGYSR